MSVFTRYRHRRRGAAVAAVALTVAASLLVGVGLERPAAAQTARAARHSPAAPPPVQPAQRVPVTTVAPAAAPTSTSFAKYDPTTDSTLPPAASATVSVAGGTVKAAGLTEAGTLPVSVGRPAATKETAALAATPATVTVKLTDQRTAQAAGIHGILFSLAPNAAGPLQVSVDPSSFRAAYGGDYAARLHLVRLPGCALTTPQLPACQTQTPLASPAASPLTAQVTTSAGGITVLAATSGASGSSGTYSATSLSPTGTWAVSGNTGAFDYSYPIPLPGAIGGATPSVALSYDSSSQDGRTEGTNNQSSWVGDGWSTTENYIERTYEPCSDVSDSGAPQYAGDECWAGQVLTLSLNGQSTQIAYDDTTHTFHAVSDSATTKIENLTGASNGAHNGEYWRITENGVQYYFGLNHLPGYTSSDTATQSAWTVPVYGSHSGDPCHAATFADSSCDQGWRWNLDYVVDLHGNASALYYTPEHNYYGADMKTTGVEYVRGGYLNRIDYGLTASTVYSATAPEQVVFNVAERCIPGVPSGNTCADSQFTVANASYWPDAPADQNCASGASCPNHDPSFWTRKRLTSIVTQIQVGGQTRPVDEFDLAQSFPDGGDHSPTLWLDSVTRVGLDTSAGGAATIKNPAVSFDPPLQLANRVGTLPSIPVMYHDRIQDLTTETGAQITVTYNKPTCTPTNVPADPATNTMPCFPVYWIPYGATAPELDWFQKYTVKSVLTQDNHDPNPDGTYPELLTTYTYNGGAAWHYDDNEVVKAKDRTYGQFRGYASVDVRTGDPAQFHLTNQAKVFDQRTLTTTRYFRGMSNDTPSGTGGTAVTLTSLDGKYSAADADDLAGQVFETDTYASDGGALASAQVGIPTVIGPTASQARPGLPPLTAQIVQPGREYDRSAVTGGWRSTETDDFYDTTVGRPTTGMLVQADARGDTSDPAQARCVWNRYVSNPAESLTLLAETIASAQDCKSAGASPTGPLISDVRTSYDGHAFTVDGASPAGTAPAKGDPTATQSAAGATGAATAPRFVTTGSAVFDAYGRVVSTTRTPDSKAPNGSSLAQTTTTTYSPAAGAIPTQEVTKDQVTAGASPTYETSTTVYDPARALPVERIDIAGLKTDLTYDALGRLTAVWRPNQSKAAGAPASLKYTYAVSTTGPTVITSYSLLEDGTYSPSEELLDALMRSRQEQSQSENGTTTVTDTQYDTHGWPVVKNNTYTIGGPPGTALVKASPVTIPSTTVTDYDGQGRADLVTDEHNGNQTSTSVTAYAGDRTTTVPPTGGVTQTTYTNALGQTTEGDQYTAAPHITGSSAAGFTATGGTTSATEYTYTPSGKQQSITAPDHTVWSFTYDLADRQTKYTNPDTGTTTYAYDDAGNQVAETDGRGVELDYSYDLQGRKLTETDKATGFLDASWTYDTLQTGKPTSSTRYVPGVTGGYTVAVTGYTSLGNETGRTYTLPASEAPLPTTYTTTNTYSVNDQLQTGKIDPRVAGLPGETIGYGYDQLGSSTKTSSTLWTYVGATDYSDDGLVSQRTLGPSSNPAYQTYGYDAQTRRLTDILTSRTQAPGPTVDDTSYTYDASGNPLSTTDVQQETGTAVTDTQCFQYDALDRLREAWTAAGACPAAGSDPTEASVATGPAAYWQSYSYDPVGDRLSETDHAVNGQSADSTTTYTDGGPTTCSASANQAHTLTRTSTTGPSGTSTVDYCSGPGGQTTDKKPSSGPASALAWNPDGSLASVTQGTDTTGYVYDADGNLLIRRDPGKTTLFTDDTEIVADTSVTPAVLAGAVRDYTAGPAGPQVAVRSTLPGGGVAYTLTDAHQSVTLTMDTTTQAVSRKALTPFGQPRGTPPASWPDPTRGFLDKPVDAVTGYTDVGAREYDPDLGRFISADPVLEGGDPAQIGGYAYAGDNPITHDDPSGRSWWGTVTHVVNTVANVAHVVAPVLNVVAAATAAVPGVDVVTAGAAGIADTVDMVATVAQGTVAVINDIKDGKPAWETAIDVVIAVCAVKCGTKLAKTPIAKETEPVEQAALRTGTGATDIPPLLGYGTFATRPLPDLLESEGAETVENAARLAHVNADGAKEATEHHADLPAGGTPGDTATGTAPEGRPAGMDHPGATPGVVDPVAVTALALGVAGTAIRWIYKSVRPARAAGLVSKSFLDWQGYSDPFGGASSGSSGSSSGGGSAGSSSGGSSGGSSAGSSGTAPKPGYAGPRRLLY